MLAPQRTLGGRYELAESLGAGGMGTVFRARDLLLDEVVALKLLHRELVGSPEAVRRFRREVKLARRITHPNIARVFDMGLLDGQPYLTMELVEGRSLGSLVERGPLPAERVARLGAQIARGLSAAHMAGVVHRDLKPENVIVVGARAVVTDFGIARAVETGHRTTDVVGTPHYMAPEQVTAGRLDERTDIYALGVVLFELATGTLPFPGDSAYLVATARLARPAPDPRTIAPVPDDLAAVIARCLERDPARRFASAAEVASLLERALAKTEPAPPMGALVPRVALQIEAGDDLARGAATLFADALRRVGIEVRFAHHGPPLITFRLTSRGEHVVGRAWLGDGRWAREIDLPAASLACAAAEVAAEIGAALGLAPSEERAGEALPVSLVRARGAAHRSDGLDDALALLEATARERAGDDAVHCAYAAALLRRAQEQGDFDGDLDEALALAGASRRPEAAVVAGAARLELGDALGATVALSADRGGPAWSALLGRLLAQAAGWAEARVALDQASLGGDRSPALTIDLAFAEAAIGDHDAARARIDRERPELASWWLARARLALWAAEPATLRPRLGEIAIAAFVGRDDLLAFVAASCGAGSLAEALRRLDEATARSPRNRRRAACLALAGVELAVSLGDQVLARQRLDRAAAAGLVDLGWLEACPLVRLMGADHRLDAIRARAFDHAETLRRALEPHLIDCS